jgi:hypothetical protein
MEGIIAMTPQNYLGPTAETGRAFFSRCLTGAVAMLNLLRFRTVADYSATPELAPAKPISGEEAYRSGTKTPHLFVPSPSCAQHGF